MNLKFTTGIILFFWSIPCFANNTSFLPGDAFFYFRADKNTIGYLHSEKDPIVTYGSHWDGGYGCGSAGFSKLKIPNLSQTYVEGLKIAYREMLPEIEEAELAEDNKISVFIYNQDFDWKKHHIALQYNENWAEETVMFGHRAEYVRLESFVSAPTLISISWRDSKKVAPLNVKTPKIPKLVAGEVAEELPELQENFLMLVFPNRKFDEYSENYTKKLRLFEITKEGTKEYLSDYVKWKLVKNHSKTQE